MVDLFNQMTEHQSSDEFFKNLINIHYEKFKYLYHMIGSHKDDVVITGVDSYSNSICVSICVHNQSSTDIYDELVNRQNDYSKAELFNVNVTKDGTTIQIKIELSKNSEEAELYVNRLI